MHGDVKQENATLRFHKRVMLPIGYSNGFPFHSFQWMLMFLCYSYSSKTSPNNPGMSKGLQYFRFGMVNVQGLGQTWICLRCFFGNYNFSPHFFWPFSKHQRFASPSKHPGNFCRWNSCLFVEGHERCHSCLCPHSLGELRQID